MMSGEKPQNFPTSRRQFTQSALFGAAAGFCSSSSAQDSKPSWEIVKYQQNEYVTAKSVNAFYRFQRFTRDGKNLLFRSTNSVMKWQIGSKSIFINDIKFSLSFPVVEVSRKVIISRVDLQKLLDPVLRPWQIKNTQPFHTVTIDAGHGGHDGGARGAYGNEKDFALEMARRLADEVKALGLATHLTRNKDKFLTLPQRVAIANQVDQSIFVSLHFNSSGDATASGIETFALAPQGTGSTNDGTVSGTKYGGNQRDAENIALATAVHAMVMNRIDAVDRGIKRARFNVLRGITKPAILFEGGFLTHGTETKRIASDKYRRAVASSIAAGIQNFRRAIG